MLGPDAARALDLLDRAKALTPEQDPTFPRWAIAAREGGRLPEAVEALKRAIGRFEDAGDVPHAGEAPGPTCCSVRPARSGKAWVPAAGSTSATT
jgi:hypothetical protein